MYLIDSNVILEFLLDQENADVVERFFLEVPLDNMMLSEFSLYSLGIILLHRKKSDLFLKAVVEDLLTRGKVKVIRLNAQDMPMLVETAQKFQLDFDDAYQYAAAEKYDLTLVSFDADFDRTPRGRKMPADVLKG